MATTNDILRVTLQGTGISLAAWNHVYHYRVVSGTQTDYDVILLGIEAAFDVAYALMEALTHQDIETGDILLSEWDFAANEFDGKAQSSAGSLDGSNVSQGIPSGNACVMRMFTQELRRQARKFFPGLTEVDVDGNTLSAGYLVGAVNFVTEIVKDIAVGGLVLRPCTFNDTPLSPRFETSSDFTADFFVNSQTGYQRRRQPGAGI